jgi:glucose repression regulatory protein TUP1
MQSNMPPGVYHNRTMMPAQGGAPSARLTELLEAIKNEFEAVTQDTSIFKMQRDEFEHKSM